MNDAMHAIAARKLSIVLGTREVVREVDLSLVTGRWTAIVGPNGAGKTTLLRALAGLIAFKGLIQIDGRDVATIPNRERARQIAWLGQNEPGAQDLLAYDVVMLGRLPHQAWLGSPSAADRSAVEAAMRETQSWDWRDRPLGQLSGGERQRVLLARALAVQAAILIMDEPLGNLDPPHQADWLRIVRAHVQRGGTAVSVLHEITMALHADDMVLMQEGRISHHGACAHSDTHRALEKVFDNRIGVRPLDGHWVALPMQPAQRTP
ncbi:ABC transporter ATP-binding protein [Caenimonas sp. SL110]|uniref:ABC transporter ATP-binding protein n=1 Tax=Caenimonas sp. SL110 TaxID=1450524 RepID=UPI001EE75AA3|nr:ABC transporter ATP-binding protein [Caenimonas sp. SL110]